MLPDSSVQWPRPSAWMVWAIGWWAGVGMQCLQAKLWSEWAYAGLTGTGVILALHWWHSVRLYTHDNLAWREVWALLAAVLLASGSTGYRATQRQQDMLDPSLQEQNVLVRGWVAEMAQELPAQAGTGKRFRFQVESAWQAQQSVSVPSVIEISWWPHTRAQPEPVPSIRAGEQWQMTVRLRRPDGLRNPGLWDYERWLWTRAIGATAQVRWGETDPAPIRLPDSKREWIEGLRESVRDAMPRQGSLAGTSSFAFLSSMLSEAGAWSDGAQRSRGIVMALVTGEQRAIQAQDWQLFRIAGIVHLFSVSGLHVTMFAWVAMAAIRRIWQCSAALCTWWPAPVAAIQCGWLCALVYALFSGWGVPAQRTVFMLGVWVLLQSVGVRWPWKQVWLVAGTAILVADPWAWWQAGFWLSFVAVGVLMATAIDDFTAKSSVRKALWAFVREQWALTLALTPWLLWWFGEVSSIGWLANALAIPWVTLVLTPLSFLGVLWTPAWEAAAWSALALLWLISPMAQWPGAVTYFAFPPWWAAGAAMVGGLILALPWPWRIRCMGLAFIAPALLWLPVRPEYGHVDIWTLDVGQGSAVVVRTATHTLVYDTGPQYSQQSDAGQRVVVPWLRAWGDRPDRIVLSHGDSDHTGGFIPLRHAFPQAQVMGPMARWEGVALQPCRAGIQWQWDGVTFNVLHPSRTRPNQDATNADSCVIQILAGLHRKGAKVGMPVTALLTGDIKAAQERALVQQEVNLRADWVLAPHHGSRSSSSSEWVQATRPAVVAVQSAYHSRYGHPAPEVVRRWEAAGSHVVSTGQCGAMYWMSWQPETWQCEREIRRGYWQSR